jgi:hypothetical protein
LVGDNLLPVPKKKYQNNFNKWIQRGSVRWD